MILTFRQRQRQYLSLGRAPSEEIQTRPNVQRHCNQQDLCASEPRILVRLLQHHSEVQMPILLPAKSEAPHAVHAKVGNVIESRRGRRTKPTSVSS